MQQAEQSEPMSFEDFAERYGVTLEYVRTDRNPSMRDSGNMDHWNVTLRCDGDSMTLTYSKGYGHKGAPPDVAEVLECLHSDASCADYDLDEFIAELGGDEHTYRLVQRQAEQLRDILGDSWSAFEGCEG